MNATITEALTEQHRLSEKIRSDAPKDVTLGKKDVIRQGDIYIARLSKLPKSVKPRKDRQLADGTTQGSRHVLTGEAELFNADPAEMVNVFANEFGEVDLREYQIGPVFRTAGPVTIEHPEHGHRTLTEPGCYGVVFQRSLDADGREERARD